MKENEKDSASDNYERNSINAQKSDRSYKNS